MNKKPSPLSFTEAPLLQYNLLHDRDMTYIQSGDRNLLSVNLSQCELTVLLVTELIKLLSLSFFIQQNDEPS